METHKSLVLSIYNSIFGNDKIEEDDKVWKEWSELHGEYHDLLDLMKADVRDQFKARAVSILLAPDLNYLPFKWKEKIFRASSKNYLSLIGKIPLELFSSDLLSFATQLLYENIGFVRKLPDGETKDKLLFYYNSYIISFLGAIKEPNPYIGVLFEYFQINDIYPFCGMDDSSGYNPFADLLRVENVSENWKKLADKKMRDVIMSEINAGCEPRADWEVALDCYADIIQLMLHSDHYPYSDALFASQIEFILSLPQIDDRKLFNEWHIEKILKRLDGEDNKQLRHRFARHVVLGKSPDSNRFPVYSPETKAAAEHILEEFKDDAELIAILQPIYNEGLENIRQSNLNQKKTAAKNAAALSNMK